MGEIDRQHSVLEIVFTFKGKIYFLFLVAQPVGWRSEKSARVLRAFQSRIRLMTA
jgi:hypothetical protein